MSIPTMSVEHSFLPHFALLFYRRSIDGLIQKTYRTVIIKIVSFNPVVVWSLLSQSALQAVKAGDNCGERPRVRGCGIPSAVWNAALFRAVFGTAIFF